MAYRLIEVPIKLDQNRIDWTDSPEIIIMTLRNNSVHMHNFKIEFSTAVIKFWKHNTALEILHIFIKWIKGRGEWPNRIIG